MGGAGRGGGGGIRRARRSAAAREEGRPRRFELLSTRPDPPTALPPRARARAPAHTPLPMALACARAARRAPPRAAKGDKRRGGGKRKKAAKAAGRPRGEAGAVEGAERGSVREQDPLLAALEAEAEAVAARVGDALADAEAAIGSAVRVDAEEQRRRDEQAARELAASAASAAGDEAASEAAAAAELLDLVQILPPTVREVLLASPELDELVEVVLDLGRPALARFPTSELECGDEPVSERDLEYAVDAAGEFGSDNRAGLDRTLHRISCIRSRSGKVVGLTCRVGRAINGCRALAKDLVEGGGSLLLMGRPGVGKTTAVREIARFLADECLKRVVIVDTSNEIGGDGDVPHPGVGRARRLQVPRPELQHEVMIEAVQNHMPQVIVIDEIGTEAEALAARTIAQRGVQLVATAHGNVLDNILKNPALSDLVGGIGAVTLSDDEAKRRGVQKTILERQGPPTFECAVEMEAARRWRVHRSVGEAVDSVLLGRNPPIEVREMVGDECITVRTFDAPTGAELGNPDRMSLPLQAGNEAYGYQNGGNGAGPNGGYGSGANYGSDSYADAPFAGIRIYLYALDASRFSDVITFLELSQEAMVVDDLHQADCVLALRSAIKGSKGEVLKAAGQRMGIPVFAIKQDTVPAMTRTLRAVLGLPGDDGDRGAVETAAAVDGVAKGKATKPRTRAERKAAAVFEAKQMEDEALEEARYMVERIVQPLGESVDLAPREAYLIEAQATMIAEEYALETEVRGGRLRILPINISVDA